MHITSHTDYALRMLMFLQVAPGGSATVRDVSEAYDISANHLAKVAQSLVARGWVESRRGRGGGLVLAEDTPSLRLGALVQELEPDALVECHTSESTCPIEPACKLKGIFSEGLQAFYEALNRYTLADLAKRPKDLARLFVRAEG